jgi:putative ABC transport system permease protein
MPSSHSAIIRKTLISFQFFVSFALIFGTLIFYKQSDYLIHKDIGMNTRNMLVIKSGHADWNSFPSQKKLFKAEMEKHPGVLSLTNSNSVPGIRSYVDFLKNTDDGDEMLTNFSIFDTDYDFVKTMGIKMIAGRELSEDHSTDTDGAIITRSALNTLGFNLPQDALNQRLISDFDKREMEVVGICEDFKLSNLSSRGYPYLIRILENQNRFITIRYLPEYEDEVIRLAREKWGLAFNGLPFRYFFLDQNYRTVYANEVFQTKLISIFSILAVILAALGLFGMTYFIILKREREFCIRKVNGALIKDVFLLVTKGFIHLIAIASLLSMPLAWWLALRWMENYPTHIVISWWYFFIPFLILAIITLLTISYHTIRTAEVNPARLLRNE